MFKALLLEQEDGKTQARVQDVAEASLPAGEVLLAVHYSSLNYKDGLAITGKGPIVRLGCRRESLGRHGHACPPEG